MNGLLSRAQVRIIRTVITRFGMKAMKREIVQIIGSQSLVDRFGNMMNRLKNIICTCSPRSNRT